MNELINRFTARQELKWGLDEEFVDKFICNIRQNPHDNVIRYLAENDLLSEEMSSNGNPLALKFLEEAGLLDRDRLSRNPAAIPWLLENDWNASEENSGDGVLEIFDRMYRRKEYEPVWNDCVGFDDWQRQHGFNVECFHTTKDMKLLRRLMWDCPIWHDILPVDRPGSHALIKEWLKFHKPTKSFCENAQFSSDPEIFSYWKYSFADGFYAGNYLIGDIAPAQDLEKLAFYGNVRLRKAYKLDNIMVVIVDEEDEACIPDLIRWHGLKNVGRELAEYDFCRPVIQAQ
jgi:hypothetical protein